MLLIEWMKISYRAIKEFYSVYILLMVVSIGLFSLLVDYKSLKAKKLKKEMKICRFIGAAYVIGGIGLFVILKLF